MRKTKKEIFKHEFVTANEVVVDGFQVDAVADVVVDAVVVQHHVVVTVEDVVGAVGVFLIAIDRLCSEVVIKTSFVSRVFLKLSIDFIHK